MVRAGPRNAEGVILLIVLIMLLTISLIGATLASFFLSVTTIANLELAQAQALYLAEAGVARALHELHQAALMGGEPPLLLRVSLGEGEYEIAQDPASGLITSTGWSQGVRRTVQVRYTPF